MSRRLVGVRDREDTVGRHEDAEEVTRMVDPIVMLNAVLILLLCIVLAPLVRRARRSSKRVFLIAAALEAGSLLWCAEYVFKMVWPSPQDAWPVARLVLDACLNTGVASSYAVAGWGLLGLEDGLHRRMVPTAVASPRAGGLRRWCSGRVGLGLCLAPIGSLFAISLAIAEGPVILRLQALSAAVGFAMLGFGLMQEATHLQADGPRLRLGVVVSSASVFGYTVLQVIQHDVPSGVVLVFALVFKGSLIIAVWAIGSEIAEANRAARLHVHTYQALWASLAMCERIHDDVASRATALAKRLELTSRKHSTTTPEAFTGILRQNVQEAAELVREIRVLLDKGMEAWSARICPQGLEAAIRERLVHYRESEAALGHRVRIDFAVTPSPFPVLTEERTNGLYGIASEAMNNVEAHAEPSWVSVRLACHENEIEMVIENDGPRTSTRRASGNASYGVPYMMAIARMLRSQAPLLQERPEGGMRVRVLIPCPVAVGVAT